MKSGLGVLAVIILLYSIQSFAEFNAKNILNDFHSNPKAQMNNRVHVQKYDENGKPLKFNFTFSSPGLSDYILKFSEDTISADQLGGKFVDIKNEYHEGFARSKSELKESAHRGVRAAVNEVNDKAESIVGPLKFKTLKVMEKKGLMRAKLPESPWSGDYWAIYSGQIAKRYADDTFPNTNIWANVESAITNRESLLENAEFSNEKLSPAEKFDLIIGNKKWSFTQSMLEDGRKYAKANDGKVETWMGNCHGWAPAAYMVPRPKHAINVLAADNKSVVKLYPSDIKALATVLWARSKVPTKFMGTRCEVKNPETDENGRVLDEKCFDTNPASWHLALVHQIGDKKKSMIIDATFDYEVWNQPVYSYEYSYFNPQTLEQTNDLNKAMIQKDNFTKDKFKKYRGPNAEKFVGIAMKLTYIAETRPNHSLRDNESQDRRVTVNYLYDLELDANDEIKGGEWYTNLHPDFVWTPHDDQSPITISDEYLNTTPDAPNRWRYKSTHSLPEIWKQAVLKAAESPNFEEYGIPMTRIVNEFVRRSHFTYFHDWGKYPSP